MIKPKVDLGAMDSPKKPTNEFVFFAVKSKKAIKTNLFVCFSGETATRKFGFEIY